MWAVAGALLAFAPLASAAVFGTTTSNARVYANEVISSGDVQIDYRGASPRVTVHVGLPTNAEVTAIDQGDVINVTFTLANAKFGRNVRDGDMSATIRGGIATCTGRVRDTNDGERGQSEVTFELEAADGDCTCTGGDCGGNGAFDLLDIAGNAAAAEGIAGDMNREEGIALRRLLYFPNRNDPLRPGGYRSSYSVDFARGTVDDKPSTPASTAANTHTTQYTVVEDDQVAYAIPPGTTGDVGNVRVKCEVSTQCTVYLECDHADGRSWFSQVTDPIPGRSTLVLTAEGMRDALDMADGDWTRGRMSCTVYSTREISLQVLTRSSTGVLVNNTYVDD